MIGRMNEVQAQLGRLGCPTLVGPRTSSTPSRRSLGSRPPGAASLRSSPARPGRAEDPVSGELRFRHALTRDTVYDDLLVAERRGLHRRVAEMLDELAGGGAAAELALRPC
jgi:hypothetical protein